MGCGGSSQGWGWVASSVVSYLVFSPALLTGSLPAFLKKFKQRISLTSLIPGDYCRLVMLQPLSPAELGAQLCPGPSTTGSSDFRLWLSVAYSVSKSRC